MFGQPTVAPTEVLLSSTLETCEASIIDSKTNHKKYSIRFESEPIDSKLFESIGSLNMKCNTSRPAGVNSKHLFIYLFYVTHFVSFAHIHALWTCTAIGVNATGDARDTSPAIFGQPGTMYLLSPQSLSVSLSVSPSQYSARVDATVSERTLIESITS